MTIRQLMELLSQYDPDWPVFIMDTDTGRWNEVFDVDTLAAQATSEALEQEGVDVEFAEKTVVIMADY